MPAPGPSYDAAFARHGDGAARELEAWRVQQCELLNVAPMPEDAKGDDLPYRE